MPDARSAVHTAEPESDATHESHCVVNILDIPFDHADQLSALGFQKLDAIDQMDDRLEDRALEGLPAEQEASTGLR